MVENTNNYNKNTKEMWLWLFLLISVEVTTWYFLKKYYLVDNGNCKNLFLATFLFIYAFIPFILIKLVSYEGIGIINMIWNICSTTLVIIIGYYIFNEKINNLQYFGIALGLVSIFLLSTNNS